MASRAVAVGVGVAIVAAIGAGAYYWWQHREPPYLPPPPPAKVEAPPAPPAGPKHPIAPPADAPPLPSLAESDAPLVNAIAQVIGSDTLRKFFNLDGLVRRIVATVDNLPRETVAARLNPLKPVGGAFKTTGRDATLAIAPDNGARYAPLVRVVEHVDAKKAVALYTRFYPLFQQAYEELGYPGRYFNDRVVEAIDNMLDAPELDKPIALTVPHVLYEYQDPELESRSAGQKIMMRIGRANERIVKAKLRELRQEIAAGTVKR